MTCSFLRLEAPGFYICVADKRRERETVASGTRAGFAIVWEFWFFFFKRQALGGFRMTETSTVHAAMDCTVSGNDQHMAQNGDLPVYITGPFFASCIASEGDACLENVSRHRATAFLCNAWQAMLIELGAYPFGELFMHTSVSYLRDVVRGMFSFTRRAHDEFGAWVPRGIGARVDTLTRKADGVDMLLSDPTGVVVGSMPSRVVAQLGEHLRIGCVLLLNDIHVGDVVSRHRAPLFVGKVEALFPVDAVIDMYVTDDRVVRESYTCSALVSAQWPPSPAEYEN